MRRHRFRVLVLTRVVDAVGVPLRERIGPGPRLSLGHQALGQGFVEGLRTQIRTDENQFLALRGVGGPRAGRDQSSGRRRPRS